MKKLLGMSLALALTLAAPALAAEKTIVETAAGNPNFSTLVAALKAADLVDALGGTGPFTVFAPTDEAFEKLGSTNVQDLLKPENKAKLAKILKYHVVAKKVTADAVAKLDGQAVTTLEGSPAPVTVSSGDVMIGKAKVTKTDILCSNGVIHVINRVLLPPDK